MFKRRYQPDLSIKNSIVKKLRRTSNEEVVRWLDNAHTGLGKNIMEMRKSLARGDVDQTLVYAEDSRRGTVTMLAALEVLEERIKPLPDSTGTPQSNKQSIRLSEVPRVSTGH
jgi:hypothetical protein